MQCICQCSRSTPLFPIQLHHPTQPSTSTQPVPSLPLSQTSIEQLQPTQILAPLLPASLPPISTLSEKDEPEPEQQELKPEQRELEPEQHEPDDKCDELNQQYKICMRDFNEKVLKWRTEYKQEKYKTSFK